MPNALRADHDQMDKLIGRLATLQASAFLDGVRANEPHFGLAVPRLKVVALDRNSRAVASVSFGAGRGPDYYATCRYLGTPFLISAIEVEPFRARAENLAAR